MVFPGVDVAAGVACQCVETTEVKLLTGTLTRLVWRVDGGSGSVHVPVEGGAWDYIGGGVGKEAGVYCVCAE